MEDGIETVEAGIEGPSGAKKMMDDNRGPCEERPPRCFL